MALSEADLHWNEMIEAVLTQRKQITKKQVRQLSIKERSDILKSNPVTLVDMCQCRVEFLFNEYLHSEYQSVGEITQLYNQDGISGTCVPTCALPSLGEECSPY